MMDRRNFLRLTALAGGGLMLEINAPVHGMITAAAAPSDAMLGSFLKITPEGDIWFQLTKHEMGQGVSTSLAMIVTEELGADWSRVHIALPDADLKKYQNAKHGGMGTGGSTTVQDMWPVLRQAGAAARELLMTAAARRWNVDPQTCHAHQHEIIHTPTGRRLGFGELATDAAGLTLPETVTLKAHQDFNLIGKDQSGKMIQAVVTGRQRYALDVQVPGMLYAVVARCPVYRGKLRSFDASRAKKIKGVLQVVPTSSVAGIQGHYWYDVRDGVAVVATSYWAAVKGRAALIVDWDEGKNASVSLGDFEQRVQQKGKSRTDPTGFIGDDNAMADLSRVRQTLRATYIYPYQLHSCMEPLNCTAHHRGDSVEIWAGTQAPHSMIRDVARVFQLKEENIALHTHPSGGGFGRRWYPDVALEAVCISREIGNLPVKMIWTREDDQQVNFAHCYTHSNYQASLNEKKELVSWYHKELRSYTWGSSVTNPELTWIGYDIPNIRYDFEDILEESPVQSSAWRSVVANAWAFGQECFIDEIAATLKRDPLEFRLSLLSPDHEARVGHQHTVSANRLRRVLELVAAKADWANPSKEFHQGIAAYPYLHGNSYCAMVARVSVVDKKIKVHKVIVAVDCGLVVNPAGVKSQMEGGVIWGLSALLYGGLSIEQGRVVNSNFHQNKLVRMKEAPEVEVHFVDAGASSPNGIGELAPPCAVPAIVNAIYAATGKRVRKLPLRMDELVV
jgi:isoquinoline 1-oxidoreductase beta subunit